GFDKGIETGTDEFADSAAENHLFSEEIALGFFLECSFNDAGLEAAKPQGISERIAFRVTTGVLMDSQQSGNADAFRVKLANPVAGRLGSDHRYVNEVRRHDLLEVDRKAVGEHKGIARFEVGRDLILIEI